MLNQEIPAKKDDKPVKLQINRKEAVSLPLADGLQVNVYHQPQADWLMATTDVAKGYGVAENTIRSHKMNSELIEGTHYITTVDIFDGSYKSRTTMWTKAGVVRLGFSIKSERAKMFRDWAEQVVLAVTAPKMELPKATRRNHNRLSKDRLVEILSLVALVDDKDVRTALVQKLMPDLNIPALQLQLPFSGGKGGEQQ